MSASRPDRAPRAVELNGPLGAVSRVELAVTDPRRVRAFLQAVLARQPETGTPPLTVTRSDGPGRAPGVVVTFGVPDPDEAAATVTAQGGRVVGRRGGWACTDIQGTRFDLSRIADVDTGGEIDADVTSPNDTDGPAVAYFTLGVADLERAAAFYGAVFGWNLRPVHDGAGLAIDGLDGGGPGGALWASPVPGSVLTFGVRDVVASARTVLARGGTVTRLQQRPYGIALDNCTDGRAIRFHLLQFT